MGSNKSMLERFKNTYFAKANKRYSMPPRSTLSPTYRDDSNGRESKITMQTN